MLETDSHHKPFTCIPLRNCGNACVFAKLHVRFVHLCRVFVQNDLQESPTLRRAPLCNTLIVSPVSRVTDKLTCPIERGFDKGLLKDTFAISRGNFPLSKFSVGFSRWNPLKSGNFTAWKRTRNCTQTLLENL